MQFICQSCGRKSPAPEEECPRMTEVATGGPNPSMYIPCSAWPADPYEYMRAQTKKTGSEAYFNGTIFMPDGSVKQVITPVPADVAEQISVIAVVYELMDEKTRTQHRSMLEQQRQVRLTQKQQQSAYKEALEAKKIGEALQRPEFRMFDIAPSRGKKP